MENMWKNFKIWLDWVCRAAFRDNKALDELSEAILNHRAEITVLQIAVGALRAEVTAIQEQNVLLREEVAEKKRPNPRVSPRTWSATKALLQGGGNAA